MPSEFGRFKTRLGTCGGRSQALMLVVESRAVISAISPGDLPVQDPAAGPEIGNPRIKSGESKERSMLSQRFQLPTWETPQKCEGPIQIRTTTGV